MQLSDEQINAIAESVREDENYGQLCDASDLQEFARRCIAAALRAQADARPVAWAMTYASRAPYNFWLTEEECDEAVARVGGSARKMALYTHPAEAAQPHVAVVDPEDAQGKPTNQR